MLKPTSKKQTNRQNHQVAANFGFPLSTKEKPSEGLCTI